MGFQTLGSAAWVFRSGVRFPKGACASVAQWGCPPSMLQVASLKSCLFSDWEHLRCISDYVKWDLPSKLPLGEKRRCPGAGRPRSFFYFEQKRFQLWCMRHRRTWVWEILCSAGCGEMWSHQRWGQHPPAAHIQLQLPESGLGRSVGGYRLLYAPESLPLPTMYLVGFNVMLNSLCSLWLTSQ